MFWSAAAGTGLLLAMSYLHKMPLVEHALYAPRPDYRPPVPAWTTFDAFRDSLPARDREDGKQE